MIINSSRDACRRVGWGEVMEKKVTLADIALEFGVSNVTVYNALADRPGVGDEMRAQIKEAARQMGYRRPSAAKAGRKAARDKTGNIGVVIPEQYYGYSLSFYGQLYELVVKALYKENCYGILELVSEEDKNEEKLPKLLQNEKVDGLILLGQMPEKYIQIMLDRARVPLFFLDTYHSNMELDTVISDGFYGTYMITSYLIRSGHRKIGFVGSVDTTSSIAERYWGYRRALRENGIAYRDAWEIPDRDEHDGILERILTDAGDLDAFVCNCDYSAHVVIQNLTDLGVCVPEDVSVVGFDDFLPVNLGENPITSYRVDKEQMAYQCVKSLLRKIYGKRYTKGIQVVTGKIVYKNTVLPRKGPGTADP